MRTTEEITLKRILLMILCKLINLIFGVFGLACIYYGLKHGIEEPWSWMHIIYILSVVIGIDWVQYNKGNSFLKL